MKDIPDNSIDMILCDLPYGVLNKNNSGAKWDSQIPLAPLWEQYKRIIKDNGAIVLFAQGMFTANLMLSNPKWWRYNLVWKKGSRCSGFLNANRQPLRNHEDIVVFSKKQCVYHPQMEHCEPHRRNHGRGDMKNINNNCYGNFAALPVKVSDEKFPKSVLDFEREHPPIHPTQKPVELCKYLIRTYTDDGAVVLDNCMGSGTTCIAAKGTGRHYIGFELDDRYFNIAKERIEGTNEAVAL